MTGQDYPADVREAAETAQRHDEAREAERHLRRGEPTERDVDASPCHPYDEKCGGSGGPCRNHGGTFPVERNRREQAERDVEALAAKACVAVGLSPRWAEQLAPVLAVDLTERIADARREGAADELERRADALDPGDHHCFKPWCPHCAVRTGAEREREALRKRAAALRGDA